MKSCQLRYVQSFSVSKEFSNLIWCRGQPSEVRSRNSRARCCWLHFARGETKLYQGRWDRPGFVWCCVAELRRDAMPFSCFCWFPSSYQPHTPSPQAQWICSEQLIQHLPSPAPFQWVSGCHPRTSSCRWDSQDVRSCVEACKIYLWT